MTKQKRTIIVLGLVLAAALICVLGARPAYMIYKDISFGWTERSEEEKRIKAYAEEKGISYGEYPQVLIDLYQRNHETEEFVLNYPFREKADPDLSGYSRDSVPLFLQFDPAWGYDSYGSSCVAVTGCGPTCLAMAGYYLTGEERFAPGAMAQFAAKNGYYAKGYGSSWTLISEGAGKLGLTATELPLVKKKMETALEEGCPVILALGAGDFTSSGHYIVLTGYEEGGFRVNDPNSRANSGQLWPYERLEGQIRNIWKISVDR